MARPSLSPKQGRRYPRTADMRQTTQHRLRESLFRRFSSRFHPVARSFTQTFSPSARFTLRLPNGSIRIVGVAHADRTIVECNVRSRDESTAARIALNASASSPEMLALDFSGPFVVNGSTAASVDVTAFVPERTHVIVESGMGPISVSSLAASLELRCAMGRANVALHPDWNGQILDIRSDMGGITLTVPRSVKLEIAARTSLGKVRIAAPSHSGEVPAKLQCGMGHVTVTSC